MNRKAKFMTEILLAMAGLVVFFIGITMKDVNPAATVIDTVLGVALAAPFLYTVNTETER